jgi:phosphoglycolate phosphatase-like HAD superfamily hydrolase
VEAVHAGDTGAVAVKSDVIRAVLFDVGGPLDTEVLSERLIDRDLRAALAAEGVVVTDEAFEAAARKAINSFAPDAYKAIIWEFAGGDAALAQRAFVRFHLPPRAGEARGRERGGFELRPGIAEVIQRLHARGLLLGLAESAEGCRRAARPRGDWAVLSPPAGRGISRVPEAGCAPVLAGM